MSYDKIDEDNLLDSTYNQDSFVKEEKAKRGNTVWFWCCLKKRNLAEKVIIQDEKLEKLYNQRTDLANKRKDLSKKVDNLGYEKNNLLTKVDSLDRHKKNLSKKNTDLDEELGEVKSKKNAAIKKQKDLDNELKGVKNQAMEDKVKFGKVNKNLKKQINSLDDRNKMAVPKINKKLFTKTVPQIDNVSGRYSNGWICKYCKKKGESSWPSWRNYQNNFDLCNDCYDEAYDDNSLEQAVRGQNEINRNHNEYTPNTNQRFEEEKIVQSHKPYNYQKEEASMVHTTNKYEKEEQTNDYFSGYQDQNNYQRENTVGKNRKDSNSEEFYSADEDIKPRKKNVSQYHHLKKKDLKVIEIAMEKGEILENIIKENEDSDDDDDTKQEKIVEATQYYYDHLKTGKEPPIYRPILCPSDKESHLTLPLYQYPYATNRDKWIHACSRTKTRPLTQLQVGETGSGKTTLLDAFANFQSGISRYEQWRWKLVDESDTKTLGREKVNKGESRTSVLTCYYIIDEREDVQEKYNIKIIDTPGLGDTRGPSYDKQIMTAFKNHFKKDTEAIDYVLFVTNAGTNRWTPTCDYIYTNIVGIFGKNIKDRFLLMCTHAGVNKPAAVGLYESKIDLRDYFNFDNSALYLKQDTTKREYTQIKQLFDMALENAEKCLKEMIAYNEKPVSTGTTLKVLECREVMELSVLEANKELSEQCRMIDCLVNEIQDAITNRVKIDSCKNYIIDKKDLVFNEEKTDNNVTCCRVCMNSCHKNCAFGNDDDKANCCMMDREGNCVACKGKCHWKQHINTHVIYTYVEVVTKMTLKDLEKEHNTATKKYSNFEQVFKQKYKDLEIIYYKIYEKMVFIREKNEYLDKIALMPRPHDVTKYFTSLINQEEDKKQTGYTSRIKMYTEMKKNAELVAKIQSVKDLGDIMPQKARDLIEEIRRAGLDNIVKKHMSTIDNKAQKGLCAIF